MFCTQCGARLDDNARYCTRCGKAVDAPAGTAPPPQAAAVRRLRRDMANKKIAGVCAGFAEYFGMDIWLMRLVWVILLLTSGIGLIAYIVAWAVLPKS